MAEDDLQKLARRLRQAGRKDLTKELNKALRDAVLPLKRALPQSAHQRLPRRGGLAKKVAATKIGIRKKPEGITVVTKNQYDLAKINAGDLRKPVFARGPRADWTWAAQRVRPGWFDEPADETREEAIRLVESALKRIARQIEG